MNLRINEHSDISNAGIAFENSKGLDIEYRSNAINPYLLVEYKFFKQTSYDLNVGVSIDYRYTLDSSPWKLSQSDVYDAWTYSNSSTVIDLPYYGNGIMGTGVFFAIRTYLGVLFQNNKFR